MCNILLNRDFERGPLLTWTTTTNDNRRTSKRSDRNPGHPLLPVDARHCSSRLLQKSSCPRQKCQSPYDFGNTASGTQETSNKAGLKHCWKGKFNSRCIWYVTHHNFKQCFTYVSTFINDLSDKVLDIANIELTNLEEIKSFVSPCFFFSNKTIFFFWQNSKLQ